MSTKLSLKRTKILATIGPATDEYDMMDAIIQAGANGVRLNMSHGTHEAHAKVIANARHISDKLGKPVSVLVDLQGPKIRLGALPNDGLALREGSEVSFILADTYDDGGPIPIQYDLSKYVKVGDPLFLRDGMVQVLITSKKGKTLIGRVLNSGVVFSRQGINLPETDFGGEILTSKDIEDLKFGVIQGADYIALSFVQAASDITNLRRRIRDLKGDQGIIAKIETKAAAEHLEGIVEVADGVMVARGDLAVETLPEQVPVVQKRAIESAREHQKVAIVATQMLESMITSPQPTRAEVQDVATAVAQGADAVMLSGESAVGSYPIETVAMMRRIITYTENHRWQNITAKVFGEGTQANAISAAAIILAQKMKAKFILAETVSGRTVRNLCSFRPEELVIAVTSKPRVYQRLALVWGARSYMIKDPTKAAQEIMRLLREEHNVVKGDIVVRASGQ
ncbi:MAG TPA: pyruvate kinase, partial [Candidatus Polarisedimenticolaceae bacterium]|nr:pyruvate kinase [Candidatus Polarisedimenticolaceae bacterium]